MPKQYLFRLDDISWDMNYPNFCKIRDVFLKYDIRPIIGIIPDNKDDKLKQQGCGNSVSQEDFWHEMKILQQQHGWAIALHGYDHVYISEDSGIFRTNARSEFAGLPYDVQNCKIKNGKKILEDHGLRIDAFMAPAHSLDWNTVKALKENGIDVITDGRRAYPYFKKGALFIPQVSSWPGGKTFGIDTVCLHINTLPDNLFEELEIFIKSNLEKCGDFNETVDLSKTNIYRKFWFPNEISAWWYEGIRYYRRIRNIIKK